MITEKDIFVFVVLEYSEKNSANLIADKATRKLCIREQLQVLH